jgi:hypothetical protein
VSKDTLWIPSNAPILSDLHNYERYATARAATCTTKCSLPLLGVLVVERSTLRLFGSMDPARIMLTANPGYDPNLMRHDLFASLWRLHTYVATELTVSVKGTAITILLRGAFVLRALHSVH